MILMLFWLSQPSVCLYSVVTPSLETSSHCYTNIAIPFLIQGKRNNFTKPKSSPDTRVLLGNDVSVALMSFVSVYFSQIPFTSVPRTPVHVDQLMALISSLLVTRLPARKQKH
jgi:hypothetical protein